MRPCGTASSNVRRTGACRTGAKNTGAEILNKNQSAKIRFTKAWIRLVTALWRYNSQILKKYGISGPQFGLLRQIELFGPSSLTDLSRFHPSHLSGLTQLVDRLVEKGWIVRKRSEKDRRKVVLELTARARRVLSREKPVGPARVLRAMEDLSSRQASSLAGAMERVVDEMLGDREEELTGELDLRDLEGAFEK